MLCNKCKKRPAIVFVQRMENGEMKNEGYCLSCARELGIKPLDDIMKQFGISGEDLEAMEDRFAGMMENGDMDPSEMMQNMMGMGAEDAEDAGQDEEEETSDNGEERFVPGGAGTFPLGIFASRKKEEGEKKDPRAKEKGKKRKFLDNYCENLTQKARDGKLDAIIGRDREIYRTIQILSRRQKNNPCLIGEAGVGKTELVKQLALQLFDTVDPLIRLDMSEFMEKHAVSRLIGSPPGYVGYDEAGQLTEKVRRRPYSVVLFDEIEKAHPDVMNILLQILDEGKLNDAQGRTVNFENTVICMTSNAGSSDKVGETGFGKTQAEMSRNKAMKALSDFLRPEFLSRVDEVVVFDPLGEEQLRQIAALMLGEYKAPLGEKGIGLSWTDGALALLCEKAKGGKFGARDLRRVIRKEVEDPLSEMLISGKTLTSVQVDAQDGAIVLRV